jgi:hypothetical protein
MSKKTITAISLAIILSAAFLIGSSLLFMNYKLNNLEQKNVTSKTASTKIENQAQDQSELLKNNLKTVAAPKIYQDGLVSWYDAPKAVANPKLFKGDIIPDFKTWETGEIVSGSQKGRKVILVIIEPEGPGGPGLLRFLGTGTDDKFYLALGKYSSWNFPKDFSDVNEKVVSSYSDDNFTINSLEYPGMVYVSGLKLAKDQDFPLEETNYDDNGKPLSDPLDVAFFKTDLLKKAYEDPVYGTIYTTDISKINDKNKSSIYAGNGFYMKAPDNTFKIYYLPLGIMGEKDMPNIIWNDGTKASSAYTFKGVNGCGNSSYADDVADREYKIENLVIIGKAGDGSPVYGVRDKNDAYLQKWFKENKTLLGGYDDPKIKFKSSFTYDQFLVQYPMFFWKDELGRLIRFQNLDLIVSGGCGKPVIYLYPEKAERVSVKITPTGGLTASEPDYGNGWNVIADPDSNIKNLSDGKIYPYLFWEGWSDSIYKMPNTGFVADRNNLENLLDEKLAKSGLIQKEISDFKEFWLPRMLSENKPYYFVTFISRQAIDKLAPLEINPKPDTVIRVLMDYKGLDAPVNVPGFEIKTPERKGFTAVEWGGVLK